MTVQHPDTPTILARCTGVMLAAVTAAGLGVWGAGSATAAGLTLQYSCSLPPFPRQAMTVQLTWNTPASIMVGQTSPVLPISATATMGAIVTQGLGIIGAATVEGKVDASGVVGVPDGNISATVPLTVPRTNVPSSGSITVAATGTTPTYVFHRSGHGTITVGSGLNVHLVPKNASGGSTVIGQVDATCTLNPGQNTVLSSFEITAAPTAPTAGGARPPAAAGGPTASGTRGTATANLSGPASSETAPAAPGSGVSETTRESATATNEPAVATASTTRSATVDPRLVGGGVLAAGTGFLGCVWWLKRHRRRNP
jgi:hypothetical protein